MTEDWEWGDNPRAIDWTRRSSAQGRAGPGASPLRRELEPDEPSPHGAAFPAVEIYLDTSGSMPNPATALNVMTLAAQILAASALRKQGVVRGIVYSSGPPLVSPWMYDEESARRFLLHYAGGGTDYPFEMLKASARERSDVVRDRLGLRLPLERAGRGSDGGARVRHRQVAGARGLPRPARGRRGEDVLAPALASPRFRFVRVASLNDFGRAAADLADALFGKS